MRCGWTCCGGTRRRCTSPRWPRCGTASWSRAAAGRSGSDPRRPGAVVATVTGGAAFAALDDFTLAMPSLEDVYLALGGAVQQGLVKA
ncbi:hypothetical protein GCM10011428_45750 [Streptomyces violaceus]